MTDNTPAWLKKGRGKAPKLRWSFRNKSPLVCFDLIAETGEVIFADHSGLLTRLDRLGNIVSVTRGFENVRALNWSDTGKSGVIVFGTNSLCRMKKNMQASWTVEFPDNVLTAVIDPHGTYTAVSLADAGNVVLDSRRNRVGSFEAIRPLSFLSLLREEPTLVAAAEYGLICRRELAGTSVWDEKSWTNVGDLATAGNGNAIMLAGFNRGILVLDKDGQNQANHLLHGAVNKLATNFHGDRIVASTLENHLYWIDSDGELLWETEMPEEVVGIACDPFGEWVVCGLTSGELFRLDWAS